ncbi:MAG: universal stress protein UspA [Hyphomonadaceae bacterium]|nr:MAG: universal stress protein UspA [Hyphomonadaceae bacterium]
MAYSELLVPISGGSDDANILARAKKLFDHYKIPTTLVYFEPDPKDMMLWPADGMASAMSSTLVDTLISTSAEIWEKISAESKALPEFALEKIIGAADLLLEERANLCDLIVVSDVAAAGKSTVSSAFEEALMHGHVPALVLHDRASFVMDNIIIAWDGSAQAARALKAANYFIEKAKSVTILQIQEKDIASSNLMHDSQKLAAWLGKKGVRAKVQIEACKDKSVGATIIEVATLANADLLVAGAYGHSRAREFVFGGVTKNYLKNAQGPHLLISH